MNQIQKYRIISQTLFLILTLVGFSINFGITSVIILLFSFITGAYFCGWICPFGFFQDLFSELGDILEIKKRKMPRSIQKYLVFSRYIIALIILVTSADFIFSIISFDPRVNFSNMLLGNGINFVAIIIMILFAFISLVFERPFCNYLCYEGAKHGFISSLRLFTIKRDKDTCINCKKCDKSCPMNIEVSKCSNLRSPQCINCFECISNCPVDNTLIYDKVGLATKYVIVVASVFIVISTVLVYNIFNTTNIKANPNSNENNTTSENISSNINSVPEQNDEILNKSANDIINDLNNNLNDLNTEIGAAVGIEDGVYTGQGRGFRGIITVEVTISNERIVDVEVVQHREDRKWFNRANSIIPDTIIDTQSTDVDVVTGATYSSLGIINAVKDALDNAK